MAITGRSPRACVDTFSKVVSQLVRKTVSKTAFVNSPEIENSVFLLGFFDEKNLPVSVEIETKLGKLYFHIGQLLRAVPDETKPSLWRLETLKYNYRLEGTPQGKALLRWEYVKFPEDQKRYCRNHIQGGFKLEGFDFNKVHLPSGWVTMEEVIRFLINDLKHKPPCGNEWHSILAQSDKDFHEKHSSKPRHYSKRAPSQ